MRNPRYISVLLSATILLPAASAVYASCPIKLWSNGQERQVGPVEVTGIPGRAYYRQVGPWTYWYRNGQVQKRGTFTEGSETGRWEYWYDNGIRRKEGAFDDAGREVGSWKYWYSNGLEEKQGTYVAGLPDGYWIFRYNQVKDSLRKQGNYIKGKEDGYWIFRYENGLNEKAGTYKAGLEDGEWKFWYEDGEIKSQGSYSQGLEAGEWIYWDRTGEDEERKVKESRYFYTELIPSAESRDFSRPSLALSGHWLSQKVLANFNRSQSEPEDRHHLYLGNEGKFLEVVAGGFIAGDYVVEDEDHAKRTIQLRVTRSDGKGAVLFGIFSEDYGKLAGMYYLVDFLTGSRGRTTNYFLADYAGTDPGPVFE